MIVRRAFRVSALPGAVSCRLPVEIALEVALALARLGFCSEAAALEAAAGEAQEEGEIALSTTGAGR